MIGVFNMSTFRRIYTLPFWMLSVSPVWVPGIFPKKSSKAKQLGKITSAKDWLNCSPNLGPSGMLVISY